MARPRSSIRSDILRAARDAFARVGFEGASVRSIARAAETSSAMVVYHFETKDGLFRAAVDDIYDAFLVDLTQIAESEPDPVRRLRAILARMGAVNADERVVFTIVMREATMQSERLKYVLGRFLAGHGALLMQALSEGASQGALRPVPLPLAVPLVAAPLVVSNVVSHALGAFGFGQLEGAAEHAIDLVLQGLLPRAQTEPES